MTSSCRTFKLLETKSERLCFLDNDLLLAIKVDDLIPVEADDEMILKDEILVDPLNATRLVSGFNILCRMFWEAVAPRLKVDCAGWTAEGMNVVSFPNNLGSSPELLTERVQRIKYFLDDAPELIRTWDTSADTASGTAAVPMQGNFVDTQFRCMRTNLHVNHLWLQTMLSERIESLENDTVSSNSIGFEASSETRWNEKEDICRQLLHMVQNTDDTYLESNGNYLVRIPISNCHAPY